MWAALITLITNLWNLTVVSANFEFFQINYAHFAGKFCQEHADCVKVGRDVHIKQKCVINAFSVISKVVTNYFIHRR